MDVMEMEIDTQEEPSNELIGHFDQILMVSEIKQEPQEPLPPNPLNPLYVQTQECFYCGKDVLNKKIRRVIRRTSSEESKATILERCSQRRDAVGDMIRLRLLNNGKLIEGEIIYHDECSQVFNSTTRKLINERIKAQQLPDVKDGLHIKQKTFLKLCKYLDTKPNTYQFTSVDMINKMKIIGGKDAAYTAQRIRDKLIEYYGDKLCFDSKSGAATTYSFTKDKVIKKKKNNKVQMPQIERKKPMEKEMKLKVIKAAAKMLQEDIMTTNKSDNTKIDTSVDKELLVPSSLEVFLKELIPMSKTAAKSQESIAQTIMSACKTC